MDREIAYKIAQPPDGVEKNLWLYELCRFLTQKSNSIITNLFSDDPPCSANTCPEMRASEWQYLCAVHDPPKACSAIDYCCHTLDWAANTLTSAKHFPSRLAMGTDDRLQFQQMKDMTNIFRRVYRIYAHAWFQHRDVFWKVEGRTGLYTLFKTVCDVYGLIPEDSYTIPSEAEGLEEAPQPAPPMILRREPSGPGAKEAEGTSSLVEGMTDHSLSSAGTTKRHRHSPSVGAMSVATVVEEAEEEEPAPLADQPSHAVAPPEAQKEGAEAASEPTTSDQPTGESAEPADDSETKAAPEKAEEPESMEEKTVDEEKKEEGAADQAKPEDAKDESPATEGTDSTSVGTTDGQTESADIKPSGEVPESTESQEKNADKEEEALEKSSEKEDAAN